MDYMSEEEFSKELEKIKLENKQIKLRNKLEAERNKYRQSKNKKKTSSIVLTSAIIAIILFTTACLYIQYHIGVEVSSTLITLWFSFWTVEIVSLAGIKISKVFKNYESNSNITYTNSNSDNDIGMVG